MEFLTGVKQPETLEIKELLAKDMAGKTVKVNGAVHAINDMGAVVFVILRKRKGLLQCVYEKKEADEALKNLKEASTVEFQGVLAKDDRAPHGMELRIQELTILSEPAAPMPLPISKWKMKTSLDAKLNYRGISLRNVRERAKFKIQEGIVRGFRDFLYQFQILFVAGFEEGKNTVFYLPYPIVAIGQNFLTVIF